MKVSDTQTHFVEGKMPLPIHQMIFELISQLSSRKYICNFSILFAIVTSIGKRNEKYVGQLNKLLLIKVTLKTFNKQSFFQLAVSLILNHPISYCFCLLWRTMTQAKLCHWKRSHLTIKKYLATCYIRYLCTS